ncbi:MAG TPA: ribonuclease J [Clostridiales bacterium]|nr:ribonuclease J [Clostridiales bacterium]
MAKKRTEKKNELKVIPLGGLSEIGKNMTAFEYGNDMIIVDVGMAFAEEDMPGVDCVIQDYTYVRNNREKLRGILLTHGHEDHIGSLPYFLSEFKCPVYGGKLTVELVRHKLNDRNMSLKGIRLEAKKNGDVVRLGENFSAEFIRVNHSIADSYGLAIRTPVGTVVHSGDFKIDYTPINGKTMDLQRFAQIGKEGVLLFMCESTNIEIDGMSPSEMQVGESFQRIFQAAEGRIIVATFSSHVHRMQQIFTAAEKYNRHVCLSGRSMVTCFNVANSLGYIDMKPDTLIDISDIDKYDDNEIVVLTTGSQAEPMSALSRMAFSSHKSVAIRNGDTVIISAHPIPGNEKPIYRVINELFRLGAHVIYESLADVHVSGHAYRNEIKLLHSIIKPKYFVPVHGEYRMLKKHADLAEQLGTKKENIFILDNGDVLSITSKKAKITDHVPAQAVLIDGSGVSDPDDHVLVERRQLGADGCVCIAVTIDDRTGELACVPSVSSMGFVFDEEKEEIHKDCGARAMALLSKKARKNEIIEAEIATRQFRNNLRELLFEKTKRRPMIITNISHISGKKR